ncbi:LysR family transcriptional regulator [Arthrobacter mobilis]|uniref:LysR family transcriptional regulator n=1 Tax=Arthrobacter mobilis TaxID=2724944 RepID=A0A7X6HEF4_9MICC|nr:LysR family transcriptional regulator [Arthrobacter mobilis]NKX54734.1 LysR family transcriptional regulator [Arthrobacter mobilis]
MLDLHRLRLLRELSIRGTIASVAAALSYSPSSVSQQLSLLEREAGTELLRKSGRRLQLTAQAQALVMHTGEVLDSMERAEAALAAAQPVVSGTVRLAVFQTAALALMPNMMRTLRESHPQVRVELVQHEPETALHETWARNFDLVVAEQYPGHAAPHYAGLDRQLLTRDDIRLAVPADLSDAPEDFRRVRALADAAGLPWVMEPHGAASRHWAEQACRSAGFEPDVRFETPDLQAHVRLVESGNAVALLPQLVWAHRQQAARLVDLAGQPQRTIFTAMRRSSARHPAIAAVRQALETEAAALGAAAQ